MQTQDLSVSAAEAFAWAAHAGQKRKYCGSPYICHPAEVVGILKSVGITDSNVLAAGWLHDTVEDNEAISQSDIQIVFGTDIARLVEELTDTATREDGNRKQRKEIERQRLAKASPYGQSIKLADIISNTRSIIERDPDFAVVYLQEKKMLLEVLIHGHPELIKRAKDIVDAYYATEVEDS